MTVLWQPLCRECWEKEDDELTSHPATSLTVCCECGTFSHDGIWMPVESSKIRHPTTTKETL